MAEHALAHPDRVALTMASGEEQTYGRLAERANRLAHLFRQAGLERGDGVVLMLPNSPEFFEVTWAAQQCGLYYTPVNTHLLKDEVRYIIEDSGAKALIVHSSMVDKAGILSDPVGPVRLRLAVGGEVRGFGTYEDEMARVPCTAIPDPSQGTEMMYSSGTTGRPKAVKRPLPGDGGSWAQAAVEAGLRGQHSMAANDVYLCPAPLYHSAPLVYTMAVMRVGATALVMDHFDPELALELIQRHGVTHAQFVPTMFVRLLKLGVDVRSRYDISSLRVVIHAAAPCPVQVKDEMMQWWGPIIHEYYAGTEGFGGAFIGPQEWLAHRGSVGRPTNPIHIFDDGGQELAPGQTGTIYFEGGPDLEYLNDPLKTASVRNEQGHRTLGDVGYLDEQGYLYLTDRAGFMVVSGGVNIYPQEVENVLVVHPRVADVAVFGIPSAEFGQEVKAVVQPLNWEEAGSDLAQELMDHCRARLAAFKCPRSIDFEPELPRDPNGKLYKRRMVDRYWSGHDTRLL
ncbi:MAG: acyl-CoA synthetase [Acidimicrobiales bacterium]